MVVIVARERCSLVRYRERIRSHGNPLI
jgi:hypothetical protein